MPITRLKSTAAAARWLKEWTTGELRSDSREVRLGDAFVAWPGYVNDGRRYVESALAAGAATCLVEADGVEAYRFDNARIGALPDLKAAAGEIADLWFDQPSRALDVIAVTGTNGKTSTAWWCAQALGSLGQRCGMVGTLGIGEPPRSRAIPDRDPSRGRTAPQAVGGRSARTLAPPPGSASDRRRMPIEFTGLTTPDPVRLHGALRRMADAGFAGCAMEASSIGVLEHRLGGVHIAVAVLTIVTRDDLDYHGTMDAYWEAKAKLFAWPGLRAAVVNLDDARGAELAAALQRTGIELWSYSTQQPARLQAEDVGYVDGGLGFELREGMQRVRVQTALIGGYNASNLLAVIGAMRALGVGLEHAANACGRLGAVPGRMQRVGEGGGDASTRPEVVVDYAHTPDALEKAILALRPLADERGGVLWCVFGCGGNRDATKRPLMGEVAARLADWVVLTSDNPRDEKPRAILAGIIGGVVDRSAVEVIEDRRDAIARAVLAAAPEDVVLIAGKGHEDYQEVSGVRHPFSDVVEAERALRRRADQVAR
jgi:UDP-N-acetylmuramoyl-L-alanyl-D-glutamate--2,6-diaminopimelate ligase